MHPMGFDDLMRLPIVAFFETSFAKATGMPLKVVAPDESEKRHSFGESENVFCALVAGTPEGCAACKEAQSRSQRAVAKKLITQQFSCFAGLTDVAVPLMVGGRHVATLMCGQVFRREPTERDFQLIAKMVGSGQRADWEKKARHAYFRTPVVTAERFQAIIEMLTMFAQYLADSAGRQALAQGDSEPVAVTNAKRFIQEHVEQPISLEQVVQHVGVSRFYFCKLFKKATSMTLTEYVARMRVEKAKQLLIDPSLRISEIVFAAGFGSIPRFNSVFKEYVGVAPTEYRTAQRAQYVH